MTKIIATVVSVLISLAAPVSALYYAPGALPILHRPCPADGSSCKILVTGDGLAEGAIALRSCSDGTTCTLNGPACDDNSSCQLNGTFDFSSGGFISVINALAESHGKLPIIWVGRFSSPNPYPNSAQQYYWLADGPQYGIQEFFPTDTSVLEPHIQIIHGGTTDLNYSADAYGDFASTPAQRYLALVQSMQAAAPNSLIIMTKVPAFSPTLSESVSGAWTWWNSQVDIFNRFVEQEYWQQRSIYRHNVALVDANVAVQAVGDPAAYSNFMYLSTAGYAAEGQAYYNLLAPLLP